MTSTFEGFGLVLVEAMQHGCVPIAFDSYPAVRDIISHGENGILIPPFQEEDYSNAIMALTNNPDEMKPVQPSQPQHIPKIQPRKPGIQVERHFVGSEKRYQIIGRDENLFCRMVGFRNRRRPKSADLSDGRLVTQP